MLKRNALMLSLAVCAATILIGSEANAGWRARTDRNAQKMASQYPWHSEYAHTAYGRPLALVGPPTAAPFRFPDDLAHSIVFQAKTTDWPAVVSARPMECAYTAGPLPEELTSVDGFKE